jgi:hypothetical protein
MNTQEIEVTAQARGRAAKKWVEAIFTYGADLQIIDAEHGYWIQFAEPEIRTGNRCPGPYPAVLKSEIRAILVRLGKVSKFVAAA